MRGSAVGRFVGPIGVIAIVVLLQACSRDPVAAARAHLQRGDSYMALAKYREASIEYRNALKYSPNSVEAHSKLAAAADRASDVTTALSESLRVAELDPENPAAQIRAASIYLLVGRCGDARDRAQAALDIARADPRGFIALGEALGCLQDRTHSVAALQQAVRLAPASADARVALASAYWADNRQKDAEAELEVAIAAAPTSVMAHRALALMLMATGRAPAAEQQWKAVADLDAGQRLALADYYVATNRLIDAERELTRVIAIADDDEAALLRLAGVQFARGDTTAAFATLSPLVEQKHSVPARILHARLLASSGRVVEALADARAASAADPRSLQAHLVEGDLLNAAGKSDEAVKAYEAAARLGLADPAPLLRIANLYLARGRSADAVAAADRARTALGNTPAIALVLVEALTRAGQVQRGEQEARAAIAAWPRIPAFHAELAAVALATNRADEARREFGAILALTPHAFEGIAGLTALDLRDRRPEDARHRVDAALRARPRDRRLLLLAAQTSAALGDHARAEATLKRLISESPDDLDAFSALGGLYLRAGRLVQAREQFTIAAKSAPTPAAATMVGLILEAEGRRDAARDQYEQTLARHPHAAIAANNLAWIYLEQGRVDEALRWATVAHEGLPRRAEVADTLGSVYLQRGEFSRALQWLANAADLRPDNPTYQYHLATAHLRTGQRAAAANELARAIESPVPFIGRENAVRLFAELGASSKN